MLQVIGNRIMIKPDQVEKERDIGTSQKLIIVMDEKRERAAVDVGTVVQIGPAAWFDFPAEFRNWCKVGDRVIYARHSGKFIKDPDSEDIFVIVNDNDVQVIVKDQKKGKKKT